MHRVRAGRLVRSDTSDLGTVRRVARASLGERVSEDGDNVVPSGKDQEPDQLFVSVDDEVTAERGGFFVGVDEGVGGG